MLLRTTGKNLKPLQKQYELSSEENGLFHILFVLQRKLVRHNQKLALTEFVVNKYFNVNFKYV